MTPKKGATPTVQVLRQLSEELSSRGGTIAARSRTIHARVNSLDGRFAVLEKRHTAMEVRLATELGAVGRAVADLVHLVRGHLDHR